jgi:ABC-2 type transport system permease protein
VKNKKSLLESLQDKRVRHGGYAAVITAAVLVGLVVINLLVQQIPTEVDLTESKLFSITEQTEKVLDNLTEEVAIYAVYRVGEESDEVVQVLEKYANQSEKITLDFVDIEKNPGFIAQFEKEREKIRHGSLIVKSGENYRIITAMDLYDISTNRSGQSQLMGFNTEQRVTSAILYVTSGYTPVLYQLTGHGEYTFGDYGLASMLSKENYEIKQLDLLKTPEVPEDASAIVILSPKNDLNEAEADTIRAFLNEGGRGLFLFDFVSFEFFPVFSELLQSFGIGFHPGIVMEGNPNYLYTTDNRFLLSPSLTDHEILVPLKESKMTLLVPNSMGINVLEMKKRNLEVEPILRTSNASWVRTVDNGTTDTLPSDIPGPVNLAVSVTEKYEEEEGTRLVVMGSSGILTPIPPFGQIKGNIEYLLNSISWVNNREETISIRSKSLFKLPLRISGLLSFIYSGVVVIIVPLVVIIIGLVIWLKRRHL